MCKTQNILILLLSLGFMISLNAQTYTSIPWREGVIIKKGQETAGMIRLGGDLGAPYLNNEKVYFVEAKNWDPNKKYPKKKLIKEYKAEELDGYRTYTENEIREKVDMNFETFEIMIMGAFKKKKGKAFLKHEYEGAVDVYSYVPKPTKKIVTTAQERQQDNQNALRRSTIYLKKGGGELISAAEAELTEMLKDCTHVVEKIKVEGYGFKPKNERPKKKGIGKLLANSAGDNNMEMQIIQAVLDYNKCDM